MNIYVGHLSVNVNEADLRKAFEVYGKVASVKVSRYPYRSRKPSVCAYVVMPSRMEAEAAIEGLNGKELKGKKLEVARPYLAS